MERCPHYPFVGVSGGDYYPQSEYLQTNIKPPQICLIQLFFYINTLLDISQLFSSRNLIFLYLGRGRTYGSILPIVTKRVV